MSAPSIRYKIARLSCCLRDRLRFYLATLAPSQIIITSSNSIRNQSNESNSRFIVYVLLNVEFCICIYNRYGRCIILSWNVESFDVSRIHRAYRPHSEQVDSPEYNTNKAITGNVAGVSLASETIDIQSNRHLRVGNVDRISRIRLRGYERYPQRGHPLIHQ